MIRLEMCTRLLILLETQLVLYRPPAILQEVRRWPEVALLGLKTWKLCGPPPTTLWAQVFREWAVLSRF